MTMQCTKCNGKGTAPRQAPYNNANSHPHLASTEGSCEHCDGSGSEPPKTAKQIAAEAKGAAGN